MPRLLLPQISSHYIVTRDQILVPIHVLNGKLRIKRNYDFSAKIPKR